MNNIYNNKSTLLYSTAFLGLVKYFFDNVFVTIVIYKIFIFLVNKKIQIIYLIFVEFNIRYIFVINY